jgi:hypothetical protein
MFVDIKRHDGWSQKDYFEYNALSNSDLKLMREDPLLLKLSKEGKLHRPVSDAMILGSAYDDFVLSPHLFEKNWEVVKDGETPTTDNQKEFVRLILAGLEPCEAMAASYKKPTMSGTEMYEMFKGFISMSAGGGKISQTMMNTIEAMFHNLQKHDEAMRLIAESRHQVCFTGIHEETGVEVKGMLDMLSLDGTVETDLKSTSEKWDRVHLNWFKNRGYDTQRAMYTGLSGANQSNLLVCNTEGRNNAKLFDVTDHLFTATKKLDRLINEYDYRVKNDAWEHGIYYYSNGGYEYL